MINSSSQNLIIDSSTDVQIRSIKRFSINNWMKEQLFGVNLANIALLITMIVLTSQVRSNLSEQEAQNTLSNQNIADAQTILDSYNTKVLGVNNILDNATKISSDLNDKIKFITSNIVTNNLINLTSYLQSFNTNISLIQQNINDLNIGNTSFLQVSNVSISLLQQNIQAMLTSMTSSQYNSVDSNNYVFPQAMVSLGFNLSGPSLVTISTSLASTCGTCVFPASPLFGMEFTINPGGNLNNFYPLYGGWQNEIVASDTWGTSFGLFEQCLKTGQYNFSLYGGTPSGWTSNTGKTFILIITRVNSNYCIPTNV
jgi:hypothetical protein